jgi:hypothetical protein
VSFVSSQYFDIPATLPSVAVTQGQLRRYVAFHDRYTDVAPPEAKTDTTIVGVLQYGSANAPATRVTVRVSRGRAVAYRLESLGISVAGLERGDSVVQLANSKDVLGPGALSGFEISIHLTNYGDDPPVSIRIPVEADQLVLERAVTPQGFLLARQ